MGREAARRTGCSTGCVPCACPQRRAAWRQLPWRQRSSGRAWPQRDLGLRELGPYLGGGRRRARARHVAGAHRARGEVIEWDRAEEADRTWRWLHALPSGVEDVWASSDDGTRLAYHELACRPGSRAGSSLPTAITTTGAPASPTRGAMPRRVQPALLRSARAWCERRRLGGVRLARPARPRGVGPLGCRPGGGGRARGAHGHLDGRRLLPHGLGREDLRRRSAPAWRTRATPTSGARRKTSCPRARSARRRLRRTRCSTLRAGA